MDDKLITILERLCHFIMHEFISPKAGITKTVTTWLIILPYAIDPVSHKASCVL
jgi:hypothetical protein